MPTPPPSELVSYEPATGEAFWRGETGNVDTLLAAAQAALPDWSGLRFAERVELVHRFAERVKKDADGLAELIAHETGKPLWEAATEVQAVIAKVEISVKSHLERTGSRTADGPMNTRSAVRYKPHGIMAVLGPYNFPAHLPNGHIVPALLAGNVVVFKPSEKTPAVGERLVSYFHDCGIDENVVQLLIGGPDEGRALIADERLGGVLFTGSSHTGCAIARTLADRPGVITALEMGGNNPLIVWDTPKLDDAATIVIQSAYTTAGQRCTAARRLIVQEDRADALLEKLLPLIDRVIVGEPFAQPEPYMGPVIDNAAADELLARYNVLVRRGAKVLRPLERLQHGLPFLSPALVDVTGLAARDDEELFGPLLQLVRVPDFDAAIAEANATRFGLSASLVGGGPEDYDRFYQQIRAGIVNWNRPTNGASSAAPFGGVGLSGNHRPGAYFAADYCAYPIASSEADQPRASIGIGLSD